MRPSKDCRDVEKDAVYLDKYMEIQTERDLPTDISCHLRQKDCKAR